ncbi:DUF5946 family protein [Nonomuraea typhae]|uniref:DUF5946 family protein n=1 Tax=Nonomuraea typhae TaxID=2603600 RepID=A0ABW7YKA8_9ACTN
MPGCPACGAPSDRCEQLFHELITLDYSGRSPWAPLHAVSVACYFFQHPALAGGQEFYWALLHLYLRDGQDALIAHAVQARRRNSHRYGGRAPKAEDFPGAPPYPGPAVAPATFATTIEDVAVDGTFPAGGFTDRVRAWAEATVAAWGS